MTHRRRIDRVKIIVAEEALVLQQHTIFTQGDHSPSFPGSFHMRERRRSSYEDTRYQNVRANIPLTRTECRSSR